jgi:putative endonuclease
VTAAAASVYRFAMPVVYILRCSDGSFYSGSTWSLAQRFDQHAIGWGANYTRKRMPVELAWYSEFERIDEAFAWEKRIQGWSRAKKLLLIEGRYDELPGWSARQRAQSADTEQAPPPADR